MNRYIKSAFAAIALLGAAAPAMAQNTYSGYFLDNYLYRHQMNPAMGNYRNFVGFPVLGNFNLNVQGNLHLSDVLYNYNGKTVLFTNPNISVAEAMKHISDREGLNFNTRLNVINFGFHGLGGYNTVGINVVAGASMSLPGSVFSLLKEGVQNKTYDIKNLRARATGYAEIALNHSHDIDALPGLRVGGTFKFLVGGGNVEARFNRAHLELRQDSWDITSEADLYTSVKGAKYKLDYNEDSRRDYVNGIDINNPSINGFGAAVDLGATYEWTDFNFSLALLDLGGIRWNKTVHASTNGVKEFKTSDYSFDVDSDDDKDAFDDMKGALSELYQLDDNGEMDGGRTTMLGATLNLGVEYKFPLYRRLSFGLLNSTRIDGDYSFTHFRLSANVKPVNCFSASVNVAAGTYGMGFGWLLNLNTSGFSFFLGMDQTIGKLAKQGAPLNSNAQVNFGIDFPF